MLLYRLYLIEYQKNPFDENIRIKFHGICEYLVENNLFGVDLPEEFDSFESFIIKMKLKTLFEDSKDARVTTKRVSDRRVNPFLP